MGASTGATSERPVDFLVVFSAVCEVAFFFWDLVAGFVVGWDVGSALACSLSR